MSDWSSDVCSSDLQWRKLLDGQRAHRLHRRGLLYCGNRRTAVHDGRGLPQFLRRRCKGPLPPDHKGQGGGGQSAVGILRVGAQRLDFQLGQHLRSEEHTSELQSLMRISYAVFCLKKKTKKNTTHTTK